MPLPSALNTLRALVPSIVTIIFGLSASADDWPQWLGPRRDGVWRETGILTQFPKDGLTFRWRRPIGGGYSGPAVADGRVFVTDRQLATGTANPKDAFSRGSIPGKERVLCLNERDGTVMWQHEYECAYTISYAAGPRATPSVSDGKVYTLGSEGDLRCLDAATGTLLWSHNFPRELGVKTPTWGFAGHPLVDGNKVICLAAGEGSVAMAYDKDTGKELWRALTAKEPGYAPPTLCEFGGRRQLILWHPEAVNALDPESGTVLWTHPLSPEVRFGMTIPTPRAYGDQLFLTSFYNGSLMLRIGQGSPSVVWKSQKVSEKDTDGLHSVMATPWLEDGVIYSPCSYGQFRALKVETGERLWETFAPTSGKSERWGHAFIVRHADRFFLFSEVGDLILARLSPQRYEELGRARLIEPVNRDPGRPVVWSHPAFANRSVYARNDQEIVCASLAAPTP
ncbi:MAG: PQQ-like beta-propeller repeat protein [Verrucomicrobiales bacterium]|nr:PQQ-like beta-propeller repeat protein [Verrucomicrobiales bacterium]